MYKLLRSLFCKHKGPTESASCPFTGITYTYCSKCSSRIKAEKTVDA